MRITFLRPALTTVAIIAAAGVLAGGLALRPAFAVGGTALVGSFAITNCSKSSACKIYSNAGKGVGLQGTNTNASPSGMGLLGTATQNGTGVAGQANAGSGVTGSSTSGFGVEGISNSSQGVEGNSTSGYGVFGNSASSYGVLGQTASTTASIAAVQGDNNASTIAVRANGFGGPLFVGNSSSGLDVFKVDDAGNTTVGGSAVIAGVSNEDALEAGTTASFVGVTAQGSTGVDAYGAGAFGVAASNGASSGGVALGVQDDSGNGVLINGWDRSSNLKLQVQDDGTVYAHDFVKAFDTPNGQQVTTYATMSSTPNVEDVGEAQLTAGQSYVSLKRSYAATMDARFSYIVFITPEGDTRGLYVTQKTPAGFVVRENQGGRSDAAFSYRIVAKPYGSTTASLRPSVAPQLRLPHMPTIAKLHRVPKTRP